MTNEHNHGKKGFRRQARSNGGYANQRPYRDRYYREQGAVMPEDTHEEMDDHLNGPIHEVTPGSYTEQMVRAMADGSLDVHERPMMMSLPHVTSAAHKLRQIIRRKAVDNLMMADLIRAPGGICPRCGRDCPVPGKRGQYPGAVSRTDNKTEVCSDCGDQEGQDDMFDRLTPQEQWPVEPRRLSPTWEQNRGAGGSPMMPFPGPKELPDLRLHFLDRWQPRGLFERVAVASDPYNGAGWAQISRTSLQDASLWWVKEDMVSLTETTARTVPVDATGMDFQMPANQQRGLVCFERPWLGKDAKEEAVRVQVHAFSWSRIKIQNVPCLHFTWYSYLDFGAGMDRYQMVTAQQQGLVEDSWVEGWSSPEGIHGPDGTTHVRVRGGAWALLGSTTWPIRDSLESFKVFDSIHSQHAGEVQKQSMVDDRRFFAAFCSLVNMKLTIVGEDHVPNHRRKQAKRAGHPITNPSPVRIVRLREARSKDDNDRDADAETKKIQFSHRWIVNGFWRMQAYGKGRSQRRLIYIAPFMKGPKDKPLIIKDTVRVWTE